MKMTPVLLSLACLSACTREPEQTTPAPAHGAAGEKAAAEIDFSALSGRDMTVEEFVRACQGPSGFNFTYDEDTAAVMRTVALRVPADQRIAARDLTTWLDARLAPAGFACRRVGPDHLNVLLVERRPI